MNGLNWFRIGLMVFAPMPFAILVAIPLWRRTEPILGNLAGTAVIFGTAIVLILKESIELDQLTNDCLESGTPPCFPVPSSFTRYGIYAFLGLAQVIVLFLISLNAERRLRDRDTAPEWRGWGRH